MSYTPIYHAKVTDLQIMYWAPLVLKVYSPIYILLQMLIIYKKNTR